MTDHEVCPACGSESLVASGVFEHGTWIHRLTCWTCSDCRTIVAIPEMTTEEATKLEAEDSPLQRL
jgi:hypothetical protein